MPERTPPQTFHSYDPADGHGLPHEPLKAIVAPRPIGWISSVDDKGTCNLAPYSFFNLLGMSPPLLGFASYGRKDSLRNIEATGEFVYNLATLEQAGAMNRTSLPVAPEVDEFALAGLEKLPSDLVRPPRVAGSPAALECRVTQVVPLVDLGGEAAEAVLVIGQVVRVHIDRRFIADGLFDTAAAAPLARCGYASDYMAGTTILKMDRPKP